MIKRVIASSALVLAMAAPTSAIRTILSEDIINPVVTTKGDPKEHRAGSTTTEYASEGIEASEAQYKAYLEYTSHQTTPGAKRTSYANYWNKDHLESVEYIIFSDLGVPIETQEPFDNFIEGNAYFYVQTPFGKGFTRDGRFALDSEGYLVTLTGSLRLQGVGGDIQLKSRNIFIAGDGTVYDNAESVGQLQMVLPTDLKEVKNYTYSYFYIDDEKLQKLDPTKYRIRSGFYESSGVPKAQGPGYANRFKYMYSANVYVAKRSIRMGRAATQLGN